MADSNMFDPVGSHRGRAFYCRKCDVAVVELWLSEDLTKTRTVTWADTTTGQEAPLIALQQACEGTLEYVRGIVRQTRAFALQTKKRGLRFYCRLDGSESRILKRTDIAGVPCGVAWCHWCGVGWIFEITGDEMGSIRMQFGCLEGKPPTLKALSEPPLSPPDCVRVIESLRAEMKK